MRIYSMTATFGKLENQTLTLKPGLNVLHAPNEWGKSTWCAFLVNMLYGMETRVKSTKTALADKERYAPWSGVPMSGRMELDWQGRRVTIERWTKGRVPMGEFRAYETETGVAVPELTAATCGELLLGVERSVFLRSGFLRMSDLPVTQDDALRRRLNSLVTTGDESGTADALAQKLKELKNKCRYNRSGLIPQAEAERNDLREKLEKIKAYQDTAARLLEQQEALRARRAALENHRQALLYAEAEENNRRAQQAHLQAQAAKAALDTQEQLCADLPDGETALQMTQALHQASQRSMALNMEQRMLPPEPRKPEVPGCFAGLSGAEAAENAARDRQLYDSLEEKKRRRDKVMGGVLAGCGVLMALLLAGAALGLPGPAIAGGAVAIMAAVLLTFALGASKTRQFRLETDRLLIRYPGIRPEAWLTLAEEYGRGLSAYQAELTAYEQATARFREKQEALIAEIQTVTAGESMEACIQRWEDVAEKRKLLEQARRQWENAHEQAQALSRLAKQVPLPAQPDELRLSREQTLRELDEAETRQQLLHRQYGQNQGLMEALGQESELRRRLEQVDARLERLNETNGALELALSTLAEASVQLQRRFAPRISKEAQQIFSRLTHGRYDRLTICQDLSLNTGAENESVLHTDQWRSDGTVDQMYLALRLAVSRALIPQAPLILDDALVRFDDERHAAAMDILKSEGEQRQILLFTCQGRELAYG